MAEVPIPPDQDIRDRLKAARLKYGFTKRQLAMALGAPPSTMRGWESGKKPLRASLRFAISMLLRHMESKIQRMEKRRRQYLRRKAAAQSQLSAGFLNTAKSAP